MVGESTMGLFKQDAPTELLDISALLHQTERSRLLIALSSPAVVIGLAAMTLDAVKGWTPLAEFDGYLAAVAGLTRTWRER